MNEQDKVVSIKDLRELADCVDFWGHSGSWDSDDLHATIQFALQQAEKVEALEQRAEAAEAKFRDQLGKNLIKEVKSDAYDEALMRAWSAEAQLAELAKQEPVSWDNIPFTFNQLKDMHGLDFALGYEKGWERKCESVKMKGDLFTRSAPAAVPVDVVPVKLKYTGSGDFYGWGLYRHDDESSQIDTDSGDLFFRSNHDVYVCARCGVKPTRPDGAHYCHKPDPDKNSK